MLHDPQFQTISQLRDGFSDRNRDCLVFLNDWPTVVPEIRAEKVLFAGAQSADICTNRMLGASRQRSP